jgi:hypothetical protein
VCFDQLIVLAQEPPSAPPGPSPLQPDANKPELDRFRRLRFSHDGRYLLAQDNTGIDLIAFDPFRILFRVPAENTSRAEFTADSNQILFISGGTHATSSQLAFVGSKPHVERWAIRDQQRIEFTEIPLDACEVLELSPEGAHAACIDFAGSLRLVAVSSGETIFEKKVGRPLTRRNAADNRANATIDFSPDGRYVIFKPKIAQAIPIVWDMRDKKDVALKGHLKDVRWAAYIFAALDRLLMTYRHYGLSRIEPVTELVAFPSGELIEKLPLLRGRLSRAADPHFVLVRSRPPLGTQAMIQAFDYHTGAAVTNEASVLDVFAERYVAERANGELEVFETGKVGRELHQPIAISGEVISRADDRFVVSTGDQREVTLIVTGETNFTGGTTFEDIQDGTLLDADAKQTEHEEFQATRIRLRDEPPPEVDEPVASVPAALTDAQQAFLAEASRSAGESRAPDYTCRQRVTRYRSDMHADTLWKQRDVVTAELKSKAGKTEYRSVTIAGQASDPEAVGSHVWSTANFDAVLADITGLLNSGQVEYSHDAQLGKFDAVSYSFHIAPEQSHWTVREGGQVIRPARTGAIWFDRQTKRLLRVEAHATEIPQEFPMGTIELTLDYDYVELGGGKYLLPAHAEQSACRRNVLSCTKNSIDFSNYHDGK